MSKIVYCIPVSFRKCILFAACEIIQKWIRSPQHTWNCFLGDVYGFYHGIHHHSAITLGNVLYIFSRHPRKWVKVDLQEVDFH